MPRPTHRRGERGIVLLLVLWIFMTLGVLAFDFSQYMRDDAMAALNLSDETNGYYLALAGMNRALFEASRERERKANGPPAGTATDPDDEGIDRDGDGIPDGPLFPADAKWHEGTFAGGTFSVRLAGEDGKLPLNPELTPENRTVFTDLVRYVVTNLVRGGNQTTGIDRDTDEQIRQIVDSIVDWRDCDKDALPNGAEDDYYLSLSRPHRAKNGFFDSPEELLQVRGVTPEVFFGHDEVPGLVDVFSPFPKGEEIAINVGQMTLPVLRALVPAMTLEDAQELLSERDTNTEGTKLRLAEELEAAVPGIGEHVTSDPPKVIRIEARADVRSERNRAAVAAVVEIGGTDFEGPQVLMWLDRAPTHGSEEPGVAVDAQPGAPS